MSTTESETKHVQRFYIYPDGELYCHFEGEKTHWPIPEKLHKRMAQELAARVASKLTHSAIVSGKYFPNRTPPSGKPVAARLTNEEKAARKDARMAETAEKKAAKKAEHVAAIAEKKALVKRLANLSTDELAHMLSATQMSQAAD